MEQRLIDVAQMGNSKAFEKKGTEDCELVTTSLEQAKKEERSKAMGDDRKVEQTEDVLEEAAKETPHKSDMFAVVLFTACFLTAVYPPGGFQQDEYNKITPNPSIHRSGTPVLARQPYIYVPFLICNALGFFWSFDVLSQLVRAFRFKRLLEFMLASMFGAYGFLLPCIMPVDYYPFGGPIVYVINGATMVLANIAWVCYKRRKASAAKDLQEGDKKATLLVNHRCRSV
ncbi:hypothetical protein RJ640_012944 [Escallonia rubra]|uniref:PGG domain-containing protein n=1 Tax=Escallonia rubra TaxID=112253 RepID=A0AA88QIC5_9ASTE|nr:hypothetical protein RJ640_012944 [Escallonia rubra]